MRRFRFRLESVLGWRLIQLELEETKLQRLLEELRGLESRQAALEVAKAEAERSVLSLQVVEAQELRALEAHRLHLASEKARLREQQADCAARIAAQRDAVRKAEQNLRLLEKIKQRRFAEWAREVDKEQESLAAEVFLARWQRNSRLAD